MKTEISGITIQFVGKRDSFTIPAETASVHQVHGARTVVVRTPQRAVEKADGMITDVPGLSLLIRAADCQNYAIYAPDSRVLGALHVGWRGLIAGAIPEFFRVLREEYSIGAEHTRVFAGPSLCMLCAEFSDPVKELPGINMKYFDGLRVDLREIARDQFLAAGVLPENVTRAEECTRCNPKRYWTYRGGDRDAVQSGLSNFLVCTLRE